MKNKIQFTEQLCTKEQEYLDKCIKFLKFFGKDCSKDELLMYDGDTSCIANPKSQWYKDFGGNSIYEVTEYVAKRLNKTIKFVE